MKPAAAGLGAVLVLAAVHAEGPPVFVDRTAYLMGTRVRMSIRAESRELGLQRLNAALEALEHTERQLSTWKADSEISAMNADAPPRAHPLSADLCNTFSVLSEWMQETGGAFDPAIGRLIDAWDLHGAGRIPTPQALAAARSNSGFALLGFDRGRCTIERRADVTVDVGAWGKGEALDRAARVLDDGSWLIDLGGQVIVHGTAPGERDWPVAIADPLHRDRPHLEIRMRNGSLSTSAGSERDLIVDGHRIRHILDPATGQPARFLGSVTVWHPRALIADILSTALYVMGPAQGIRWAEARGLAACYLVAKPSGRIEPIMTAAFRNAVVFSD